jgi:pSer/pThr/pTyr-binding forkhead associated (FHA) protein
VLADPAIARRHAAIRMDVVGYELADLGAPDGIAVNGVRIGKKLLCAGDVIRIGPSELMFHLEKVG